MLQPHHRSPRKPNNPIAALPLTTLLVTLSSSIAGTPLLLPAMSCLGNTGVLKRSFSAGLTDFRGEEDGSMAGTTGRRMLDSRDEEVNGAASERSLGNLGCSSVIVPSAPSSSSVEDEGSRVFFSVGDWEGSVADT